VDARPEDDNIAATVADGEDGPGSPGQLTRLEGLMADTSVAAAAPWFRADSCGHLLQEDG
jgi:hypothetical protein